MRALYDAASILRKAINKSNRWEFTGSLDILSPDQCPEELHCFFRWVIQSPNTTLPAAEKCSEVHKRALHLAESIVSMSMTERQVKNKTSKAIITTREMLQQLAVSLAIYQAIQSKVIFNLLHGFRMAIEYNRFCEWNLKSRKLSFDGLKMKAGCTFIREFERFVCQLYLTKTDISIVKGLRWFLFR